MNKKIVLYFFLLNVLSMQFLYAQNETDVLNYISKYKTYAIEEQLRTGVPAAVTLAQGIHETGAGSSELATQANNHFGIKCKSSWTGETFLHDDDKKQECFRKYINAQQSYIDHSDFLRAGSRYNSLFLLEITDYVGWAEGLKKAGYATNPAYVRKLTDLVEKYNLQQYTYEALRAGPARSGEVIPDNDARNMDLVDDPNTNYKGLKGFWAKKGENLQDKATQLDIKLNKLLEFNDLQSPLLAEDMFVFTQKKKRIGTVEFHMVKENENMHIISQKEAMVLDNLYMFNNIKPGDEPVPGEQLSLQYRSYNAPKLIPRAESVKEVVVIEPVQTTTISESQITINENKGDIPVVETKISKAPATENKKVTPPPVTENKTITTTAANNNNDIKDIEKAKKVESILTGNPVEKSEIKITEAPVQVSTSQNTNTISSNTTKEAIAQPVAVAETPKPKKVLPQAPKRTYNEPGVDDSVKALKERFDNLVYRPFERRIPKVDTVKKDNTKVVVKTNTTGITKEPVIKKATKDSVKAATSTKQGTKPAKDSVAVKVNESQKNINVEKTKNGIVRDVKKIEEEKKKAKEAEAKKAKEAADKKALSSKTKANAKPAKKDDKKDDKKKTDKKPTPKKK